MKTKIAKLIVVVLFVQVFSIMTSAVFASPSLGLIASYDGTKYPFQRKTFYALDMFWLFYSDGNNMVFSVSEDALSWTTSTTVRVCTSGRMFSVTTDGTHVHYVYASEMDGEPLVYCRGILNPDKTITFQTEQTVLSGMLGERYSIPNIAVNSDGVWVGYSLSNGAGWFPCVTKSSNGGTWTTESGFPYQLSSTPEFSSVTVLPLSDGRAYALYSRAYYTVRGRLYDGSWGSEEEIGSSRIALGQYYCAVAMGDDVYIAFLSVIGFDEDFQIKFNKRDYSSGWTGESVIVDLTEVDVNVAPSLTAIQETGDVYCFWTINNIIYYKVFDGLTWGSETSLVEEEPWTMLTDTLSSFCYMSDSKIGLSFLIKNSSIYEVRYVHLTFETEKITIEIDVKPGSSENVINMKSEGRVPVAILSNDDFDASSVDPNTITFGSTSPEHYTFCDVDSDGDMDILLHFRTQELAINEDCDEILLEAQDFSGQFLQGKDTVQVLFAGAEAKSKNK